MNAMRLRADRTEAEAGLATATLPQPDGTEADGTGTADTAHLSGTGTAPSTAEDGTAGQAGTASLTERALRSAGTVAASLAVRGGKAAGAKLAAQSDKPESVLHAMKHARPHSMAAHHRAIAEIENAAIRVQMHTLGKALKIAGTALSALGDDYVSQLIVVGVMALLISGFAVLVF